MAKAHLSDSEIDAWRCIVGPYVEDIKIKLENNINLDLNVYVQEKMNIPVEEVGDKVENGSGKFRYLSKGVTCLNSSIFYTYKESPRGAASGLSRCNFFRLQTSLLSLFLVQMG